MGGKDATNAILANLRSKILDKAKKFFSPLAEKFLPENQPDHLETLKYKLFRKYQV